MIQQNTSKDFSRSVTKSTEDRWRYGDTEFYIKSSREMLKSFKTHHKKVPIKFFLEAMANTVEISGKCNVKLEKFETEDLLPEYEIPGEFDNDFNYLIHLCKEGWARRKMNERSKEEQKKYMKQLKLELKQMREQGFIKYMLIVNDLILFARKEKIRVGPGRGSCVGSLVSYLLGMTSPDPIAHGLLFSRFISPGRRKPTWKDFTFPEYPVDDWKKEKGYIIL